MFDTDEVIAFLESWQKALDVVIREAKVNHAFAERLGTALSSRLTADIVRQPTRPVVPDPYVVAPQGEVPLMNWLLQHDAATLRSIIRSFSLDPAKATSGWREQERLARFIADRVLARHSEGRTFVKGDVS